MRIAKFLIAPLVLTALLAPSVLSGGFEAFGLGTRARAMGGAFRAVADDWTAAYYNPAGYAFAADNVLGSNLSIFHLRNEVTPYFRWDGTYETGMFNGKVNYNEHEIHNTPGAGFIVRMPIWGETILGLSAYQPFDYNVSWTLYDLPEAYNDIHVLPGDQYRNDLDVVAFQLTAAREFQEDKLAIGIGLEVLRADLVFTNILFHTNPMVDDNYQPFDKIPSFSDNDGRGWGLGVRGGILYNANEKLTLAATFHYPGDITIKGTTYQEYYLPRLPGTEFVTYPMGSVEYLFVSGAKLEYSADMEVELPLPSSLGFGIAYNLTDKLTIALDGEYTLWSGFDSLQFTYSNPEGLVKTADTSNFASNLVYQDMTFLTGWKNSGKVSLGVSYEYSDFLTLMAGGQADQSPFRGNPLVTPHFADLGDKYTFSGGFTWHINQWDIGLAQSYTHIPDLTIYHLYDSNDNGLVDNFAADYKAQTFETVLSVNYRF